MWGEAWELPGSLHTVPVREGRGTGAPGKVLRLAQGRVIGYEYSPYDNAYVIYVRGKLRDSNESDDYTWHLGYLNEDYRKYLNRTVGELAGYLSTGNETLLQNAMFDAHELVITRAHIESIKRGENVTAVVLKRGWPLSSVRGSLRFLSAIMLFLIVLGLAIVTPFFTFERLGSPRERRRIGVLLVIFLVVFLAWGIFHGLTSSGKPLGNFGSAGNLSMKCQGLWYRMELNDGAKAEVLKARDYAIAYSPYRSELGEKGVVLIFKPSDTGRFLESLKKKTLVLGTWNSSSAVVPVGDTLDEHSAENLDRTLEEVERDLVNASNGRISEGDARMLLELTQKNYLTPLVKMASTGNCTKVILVFGF